MGALVAALMVGSVMLAPAARAAFPGANGKIAFASNRTGNYQIYSMSPDGSGQTRLTTNAATDTAPAWSPDGTKIAFGSNRDGIHQIYVMNSDGTGQTRLTSSSNDGDPAWSPAGTRIVFDRVLGFFVSGIYVMNADGSGQTQLTNNAAQDRWVMWAQ